MAPFSWNHIEAALRAHVPGSVEEPGVARAAVAVVFHEGAEGLELLFIKRAEAENDPWSGQIGFPGGRAEPGETDLEATAVRETAEETGLDLAGHGELAGRLDEIRAMARGRPVDLAITPYVFRLRGGAEGVASHEVVSLHWLPLAALLDPRSRSTMEYRHGETTLSLPCLRAGDIVIWGLTFRMFENLRGLLEAAQAPPG
jgi:8-oxo-dGTP pyrophosphatase MutT (NUDIX family)